MRQQRARGLKRIIASVGALALLGFTMGAVFPVVFRSTSGETSPVTTPHHATVAAATATLRTLTNHPTTLPSGALVVEAFAPWCLYCATTARWDDARDAALVAAAHLPFVMTDISPDGGVGHAASAPTLASIATTAYDGSRVPLTTNAAIAANLVQFHRTYPLTIPIDFWSQGSPPSDWHLTSIPTFLYLNAHHQVVSRLVGYHSTAQFAHWFTTLRQVNHPAT